eukprot:3971574-Amphidinium_carterae.1
MKDSQLYKWCSAGTQGSLEAAHNILTSVQNKCKPKKPQHCSEFLQAVWVRTLRFASYTQLVQRAGKATPETVVLTGEPALLKAHEEAIASEESDISLPKFEILDVFAPWLSMEQQAQWASKRASV